MGTESEETTDIVAETHAALLEYLRTARPAGVVIVDKEGKRQKVALRSGPRRYVVAARVIAKQLDDVERVELLDKRGGVVDVWNPPDVADAEEEAERQRKREDKELPREVRALVALGRIMNDHADKAVDRFARGLREAHEQVIAGSRESNVRTATLERSMSSMIKSIFESTRTRAEIEGLLSSGALVPKGEEKGEGDEALDTLVNMVAIKMGFDPRQIRGRGGAPPAGFQLPADGNGAGAGEGDGNDNGGGGAH